MAQLAENRYGKSRVRLVKVLRGEDSHRVLDWTIQILFEGDYESCYMAGDNSRILPTDTMKNTVYSLARKSEAVTVEDFAVELSAHFLANSAAPTKVIITVFEKEWEHLPVEATTHPTAFAQRISDRRTTFVTSARSGEKTIASGVTGLVLLKTADSAFAGFIKDPLTTLQESPDRLFGTELSATWIYRGISTNYAQLRAQVMQALLSTFASHRSLSVQHTLFAMGEAVLARLDGIEEITLTMPNRHCLLVTLEPFGQDNPNEIFVPTDEPHGYIEARIVR